MADSYIDLANRREVYVQRYASYLRNQYLWVGLDEAYKAARSILKDIESISSISQRREVEAAIKAAVKPVTANAWAGVNTEFNDYATQEATYYAAMFSAIHSVKLSVPASEKISQYINGTSLTLESGAGDQIGKWPQFVTANTNSVYKQMNAQIVKGYRNNESPAQLIKRLYRIKEGLLRNQAESLVRTGTLHHAVNARRAMVDDNLDIIDREFPNVTFDNRSTRICISISDKYSEGWPVNKSPIGYPPYHFGCRTIILYGVIGQDQIDGTKAFVGGESGAEAEKSFNNRNTRLKNKRNNPDNESIVASQVRRKGNKDLAFTVGQIKTGTSFSTFLSNQPEWFIADTLKSKKLAKAFINGDLDLSKLTDRDLKPAKLSELL